MKRILTFTLLTLAISFSAAQARTLKVPSNTEYLIIANEMANHPIGEFTKEAFPERPGHERYEYILARGDKMSKRNLGRDMLLAWSECRKEAAAKAPQTDMRKAECVMAKLNENPSVMLITHLAYGRSVFYARGYDFDASLIQFVKDCEELGGCKQAMNMVSQETNSDFAVKPIILYSELCGSAGSVALRGFMPDTVSAACVQLMQDVSIKPAFCNARAEFRSATETAKAQLPDTVFKNTQYLADPNSFSYPEIICD